MIKYVAIYFVLISIATAVVTVYDKKAAKLMPEKRIKESVLILLAVLGGAISEYMVMTIIRHKTKHSLFMNGLPRIFLVQSIIFFISVLIYYL